MVMLDARCKGVEVPDYLSGVQDLKLVLSYKFRHPLYIDEEKIFATLLFNRVPVDCVLPLNAIWGAFPVDKVGGGLWLDSTPVEIREKLPSSLSAGVSEDSTRASEQKEYKGIQIIQGGRKTRRSNFDKKQRPEYLRLVQGGSESQQKNSLTPSSGSW